MQPQNKVSKIWELYPELTKKVKKIHNELKMNGSGHSFDHALRVGQMAVVVAWKEGRREAILSGIAGLCHNADRILERKLNIKLKNVSIVPKEKIRSLVQEWLTLTDVNNNEAERIISAVIGHGSKPNNPLDDLVMVALTDADRLVNIEADVIIRSGQFNNKILLLDPDWIEVDNSKRTEREKYEKPYSVLWNISNNIGWMKGKGPYSIRLPAARKLGAKRAIYLEKFVEKIKEQRKEIGLIPYPNI